MEMVRQRRDNAIVQECSVFVIEAILILGIFAPLLVSQLCASPLCLRSVVGPHEALWPMCCPIF